MSNYKKNPLLDLAGKFGDPATALLVLETLRHKFQAGIQDGEKAIAYITGDTTVQDLRDKLYQQEVLIKVLRGEIGGEASDRADRIAKGAPRRHSNLRFWW